jgi:glycosyltransferase involved in cell wall biosynthesis
MKKILFIDQTGKIGGAELSLLEVVTPYRESCQVILFEDGPLRQRLEERQIPVQVLASAPIQARKDSTFLQGFSSLAQVLPLVIQVATLSRDYDLIFANTQKALVVGALARIVSNKPLVWYLHDILSREHFSRANQRLSVTLANRFASRVIADSQATAAAFVAAGGHQSIIETVYYGFDPDCYQNLQSDPAQLRQQLGLDQQFIVGHFSRLSAWKGQHVLLEALTYCPEQVSAIFVGDALFGENDYVQALHQQVEALNLGDRVQFLGFRTDIPELMAACDLIAHTSTAPEPFGRVIVEAMLCGTPVIAAAAGGAVEIVDQGQTGWLTSPGDCQALAEAIRLCYSQPELARSMAQHAQQAASQRFNLHTINRQLAELLQEVE